MHKTQLKTVQLGNTGLEITRVGFGAWAAGGGGWGLQEDEDFIAAIQRALELGINWIDTATAYGFGHSEHTTRHRSRSPGHCATPPSTVQSSASGTPTKLIRSSPPAQQRGHRRHRRQKTAMRPTCLST
ncbi:MAG TPA: aldo/keto reductase [Pseudonocardiaceae bacterium]|nr:aldo/keto reductase [Pseudonocardiaceae bacterium]